jgi:hypothetical protein
MVVPLAALVGAQVVDLVHEHPVHLVERDEFLDEDVAVALFVQGLDLFLGELDVPALSNSNP